MSSINTNDHFNNKIDSCGKKSSRRCRSTCCTPKCTDSATLFSTSFNFGGSNKKDNVEKCHGTSTRCSLNKCKKMNCRLSCVDEDGRCCCCCCCADGVGKEGSLKGQAESICKKRSGSNLMKVFKNKFLQFAKSDKNKSRNDLGDMDKSISNSAENIKYNNKCHQSLPKSWKMDRKSNSHFALAKHENKKCKSSCCNAINNNISNTSPKFEVVDGYDENVDSALCEDEYLMDSHHQESNAFRPSTSNNINNSVPFAIKDKKSSNCRKFEMEVLYANNIDQLKPAILRDRMKQKRPSCLQSTKSSQSSYEPSGYGHVSPPELDIDNLSLDSMELGADFRSFMQKRNTNNKKSSKMPQSSKSRTDRGGRNSNIVLPYYDQVKEPSTPGWSLTNELMKLSSCGWYWGPMSKKAAEAKLSRLPDGCFLVRDSSDERHLLSLSFRSFGQTLHTRIEHYNGMFSFYVKGLPGTNTEVDDINNDINCHGTTDTTASEIGFKSVIELIENSISDSRQNGVFCYSRVRSTTNSRTFPVCLTRPVSRFSQISTLQHMCRFVLRQKIRLDHIDLLPLPQSIRSWLLEAPY